MLLFVFLALQHIAVVFFTARYRALAFSFSRFLDYTQRRATVGRTPLNEWSIRRRKPLPDNTQHSQQTNIHAPGGIRTHNLSRRAAENLRLRPRGHWNRQSTIVSYYNLIIINEDCTQSNRNFNITSFVSLFVVNTSQETSTWIQDINYVQDWESGMA